MARNKGYEVILLFFWLRLPDQAVLRVKNRVKEGGHHIPENVIRRRYKLGLKNFFDLHKTKVNYWGFIDNSGDNYDLIAEKVDDGEFVYDRTTWTQIKKTYGTQA
jgi:predicted ABC-type ATPase